MIDVTGPGLHTIRIGSSTVIYRVKDDGDVEIASLRTPRNKRGKGSASIALKNLLEATDASGVNVWLLASPLDKYTTTKWLISYYERYGFDKTGKTGNAVGDPWMFRESKIVK